MRSFDKEKKNPMASKPADEVINFKEHTDASIAAARLVDLIQRLKACETKVDAVNEKMLEKFEV